MNDTHQHGDHPPAPDAAAHEHSAHVGHAAPAHPHASAPAHEEHAGHDKHAGHDEHAGHSVAMFRNRFWISLLLTIPTLVWGEMIPHVLGFTPPTVPGARWIAPVFGTAVFLYGGLVFLRGAWRELADRAPGMMTLISLAISVAFVFSAAVTLGFPAMSLRSRSNSEWYMSSKPSA